MMKIPLREGRTLHHDIETNYGSGRVRLRSAPPGTGIIAGGPLRAIFEVLGVQDVVAKSIGSQNPYNMIKATLKALQMTESPRDVARRRGLKVADVVGKEADEEAAKKAKKAKSDKKAAKKAKADEKAKEADNKKSESKKKSSSKKKSTDSKKKKSSKKSASKTSTKKKSETKPKSKSDASKSKKGKTKAKKSTKKKDSDK
jgi:type IV secretory pathway VirB10-like protein